MSENEKVANQVTLQLQRALLKYLTDEWTAEEYLNYLKLIFRAAQLG